MQKRVRVMITGVGATGHGEQLVKALRMSSLPCHIVATDVTPYSFSFMDADEREVVPFATAPDYMETILRLCDKHRIEALFHGSDPELKVFSLQRETFLEKGILPILNDPKVIEIGMNKNKTAKILSQMGFPVPRTWEINSAEDLSQVDDFPVVLKPSSDSCGSRFTFIVQSKSELELFSNFLIQQNVKVIAQEYVGNTESEYTVGVLSTFSGELVKSFVLRRILYPGFTQKISVKNKTGKKSLGENLVISSGFSQGEVRNFPEIRGQCEEIARKLGSKGPLNIQCRVVGGKVFPFEINPRFSATISIRAMAGLNEPEILLRHHILNEALPKDIPIRYGVYLRSIQEKFFQ